MKKIIATIVLAASLVAGAFAAGTVTADDYKLGEVAPGKTITAKNFVLNGAQKGASIEDKSKEPIKIGDKTFAKRIKMKGADGFIEFDVKAGDIITVLATSSSKESPRAIRIINDGKKLGDITAPIWNMKSVSVSQGSVTAVKDGKCQVKGFGGGVYIFEVDVKSGN
jgi:hypothetical protein